MLLAILKRVAIFFLLTFLLTPPPLMQLSCSNFVTLIKIDKK
jgi:hypothetical protein